MANLAWPNKNKKLNKTHLALSLLEYLSHITNIPTEKTTPNLTHRQSNRDSSCIILAQKEKTVIAQNGHPALTPGSTRANQLLVARAPCITIQWRSPDQTSLSLLA